MSTRTDLTRWNRAGLSRFRYVDGNAVTFLEELRAALAEQFPEWEAVKEDAAESGEDRRRRIGRQYDEASTEWAWLIARGLARATHVLTEHIDAYANEGYLGTATQWENVRRLLDMIDYHPAPPASASTWLVLEAKEEAAGTVGKGFQVKHSPADGGSPIVFETLEDIDVDEALNTLRPADWDRNPTHLSGRTLTFDGKVEGLKTGEPVVLEDEKTGELFACLVAGVVEGEEETRLTVSPSLPRRFAKGWTLVHAEPKDRLEPLGPAQTGATIARTLYLEQEPEGLLPGEVVHITDGKIPRYRRVTAVSGRRIQLHEDVGELVLSQAGVSRPVELPVVRKAERDLKGGGALYACKVAGDWSRLVDQVVADHRVTGAGKTLATYTVTAARYHPVVGDSEDEDEGYTVLTLGVGPALHNPQALLVPPDSGHLWNADTYLQNPDNHLPATITTSQPKKTAAGDLAVVTMGRQVGWARLATAAVDMDASTADLTAETAWQDRGGGLFFLAGTTVYAHFKQKLRLKDWKENGTPVVGSSVPLASVPSALTKGRTLVVENADDESAAFMTTVAEVKGGSVMLSDALPSGMTRGNLVIAGNVALAGHGETKPTEALGSGNATLSAQSFVLDVEGVSFVADPSQSSGVRADLEVTVDGRTYEQVATLYDSEAADPHYSVRMTEEGKVRITFGDGRRGRRLPSGTGNVRVTYRVGNGLAGNLAAGSLAKPAKPHTLVKAVSQPMDAAGGNDMEDVESLRENAASSLLTLERAVSIGDFASLAMSQSSVWQARAFALPTGLGRQVSVGVVVVPAGGGELGTLASTLQAFLTAHAMPGVNVSVTNHVAVPLQLNVAVQVKSAEYDPATVAAAVQSELVSTFSLERRSLGQRLYLSEIVAVVEGVSGVENSEATIREAGLLSVSPPPRIHRGSDGVIRSVQPSDRQVLYVQDADHVQVSAQEYQL